MSGRIADVAIDPTSREHVVRRGRLRWRLEDGERRHDLDAALRQRGLVLDRLRDDRPDEPAHDLGRHRRERRRPPRRLRRRRLPQPRRRRELAEPRPQGLAARLEDPRAPEEPGRRLGRRAGAAVVEGRRPRALQDDRRREDVDEGARRRASGRASPTSRSTRANPDVLYAATWQRQRTVAAYMGGGPESGIHRSTDGGETWEKLKKGLPEGPLGKIGLAISPQNPDVVYAAIELEPAHGRRLPLDRPRRVVGEALGDRLRRDRAALLPGALREPARGGPDLPRRRAHAGLGRRRARRSAASRRRTSTPTTTRSRSARTTPTTCSSAPTAGSTRRFDLAKTWRFVANLPVTQFYKIAVDDDAPFYNVYGGTQDNSTQGGPVAHRQRQRHRERATGSSPSSPTATSRRPSPATPTSCTPSGSRGTSCASTARPASASTSSRSPSRATRAERFNWDAPILVSPHSPKRLYYASQRVWRSDDRGDSWRAVSGDLTRDQDRMKLPAHGPAVELGLAVGHDRDVDLRHDHVARRVAEGRRACSTPAPTTGSSRSPRTAGRAGGRSRSASLPGVPASAFVNDLKADLFDADTVYVALDDHKSGDFRPYLLKSADRGRTWRSIAGDLPAPAPRLARRAGPREAGPALRGDGVRALLHDRRRRAAG